MLENELKEFYKDCYYENNLLDNEKRIQKYLSFAGQLREIKILKDNINNNRVPANEVNLDKLNTLKKDAISLSTYFRIEFDTRSVLDQNRIKTSDIDEILSNRGLTMKKIGNHEITKKVYQRYSIYKDIVSKHLNKGGELYDYSIKISSGRGNAERLEKVIEELNNEGLNIVSKTNDDAHINFHSHEVIIVTNSLHANKILNKLIDSGASKNSIDIKTAFLLPNPSNILVKEEVEKQDLDNFDPEKLSKSTPFAKNKNILAYRKENYINPQRQLGGITAKGLHFRVHGKEISKNNAYIVKNPLSWVNSEQQKLNTTKKMKI